MLLGKNTNNLCTMLLLVGFVWRFLWLVPAVRRGSEHGDGGLRAHPRGALLLSAQHGGPDQPATGRHGQRQVRLAAQEMDAVVDGDDQQGHQGGGAFLPYSHSATLLQRCSRSLPLKRTVLTSTERLVDINHCLSHHLSKKIHVGHSARSVPAQLPPPIPSAPHHTHTHTILHTLHACTDVAVAGGYSRSFVQDGRRGHEAVHQDTRGVDRERGWAGGGRRRDAQPGEVNYSSTRSIWFGYNSGSDMTRCRHPPFRRKLAHDFSVGCSLACTNLT